MAVSLQLDIDGNTAKSASVFQPYDPKRSCWVPMSEGGYVEGSIESTEGDKVIVKIGKDEKKILKKDQVQQVVTNSNYLNKPLSFAVKNVFFFQNATMTRMEILQ